MQRQVRPRGLAVSQCHCCQSLHSLTAEAPPCRRLKIRHPACRRAPAALVSIVHRTGRSLTVRGHFRVARPALSRHPTGRTSDSLRNRARCDGARSLRAAPQAVVSARPSFRIAHRTSHRRTERRRSRYNAMVACYSRRVYLNTVAMLPRCIVSTDLHPRRLVRDCSGIPLPASYVRLYRHQTNGITRLWLRLCEPACATTGNGASSLPCDASCDAFTSSRHQDTPSAAHCE